MIFAAAGRMVANFFITSIDRINVQCAN
jgi:hypothetical protein